VDLPLPGRPTRNILSGIFNTYRSMENSIS
jgi:hypothetical protein